MFQTIASVLCYFQATENINPINNLRDFNLTLGILKGPPKSPLFPLLL